MNCSLVIPLLNEAESLPELQRWINEVMQREQMSYEVIFVDDGSTDNSWNVIQELKQTYPTARGIRFSRNYGKSAALHMGFQAAQGNVVFTLDADLQDSPEEIPAMARMILEEGYDVVSGWKKERFDPLSKTIPTKLFNWATRRMTGIHLNDFNCGLKGYRKDVVKCVEVYGEMHRYIPVLAKQQGFKKIGEKVVKHQARKFGSTKFGMERFMNGFLDLLTISFMSKFGKRPMHFFGTLGTLVFMIGFISFAYIGGTKLYTLYLGETAKNIAEQSAFFIALTCMILGTILFLAGFLGELISRNSATRNDYSVAETLN